MQLLVAPSGGRNEGWARVGIEVVDCRRTTREGSVITHNNNRKGVSTPTHNLGTKFHSLIFNTTMAPKRKSTPQIRASKRLKAKDETKEQCRIADTLFGCADVVSVIFSFLEIRGLLRFVCVSKGFKSLLSYDHVVRATMLSGGFPMTSLERMIPPIRERKIWIPSPLRLLRVVCGKRCEQCNKPTRFVCGSFGVFLCADKCLNGNTKLLRRSKQWMPYLSAPRVLLGPRKGPRYSHMYLLKSPLTDTSGENIGPLITADDVEKMAKDDGDGDGDGDGDNSWSTPFQKVTAVIQARDLKQPHAESATRAILKALKENKEDAERRRLDLEDEKEEARERVGNARKKRCDKLFAILHKMLEHNPQLIAKLNTRFWCESRNQYHYCEDSIVRNVLTPVLKAPSKYNKKKLQEVADEIERVTEDRRLMEQHLQQIIDYCGHPDTDRLVLRRSFSMRRFSFQFSNVAIRDILKEPLSNPRSLGEEDIQELAARVKLVACRRAPGEEILKKLEARLDGVPCRDELGKRNWNTWNWSFMFQETYIQEILYDPLTKPTEVDNTKLDELEKELRLGMSKKLQIKQQMDKLVKLTVTAYPHWANRLSKWSWNSKTDSCRFNDYFSNRLLASKLKDMKKLTDETIGTFSEQLLTEVKESEQNRLRLLR